MNRSLVTAEINDRHLLRPYRAAFHAARLSVATLVARWIASRSLSSGAHSRDPLARNDGETINVTYLPVLVHRLALLDERRHAFGAVREREG